MGLLNKLAKKFSQAGVSGKDAVVCGGTGEGRGEGRGEGTRGGNDGVVGNGKKVLGGSAAGGAEEERVDYTCPTLKDVSVKGGREMLEMMADGGGSLEDTHGPVGEGGSGRTSREDGGPNTNDGPSLLERESLGGSSHKHVVPGELNQGRASSVGKSEQMDMRSELDTMSIGSASEMASEDGELYASRFPSGMATRDRVSRTMAALEREEMAVRGAGGGRGENEAGRGAEKREENEVWAKLSSLVKRYNDVAVGCMEGSSLNQSLACLLKAEKLLEDVMHPCHGEADGGDGGGGGDVGLRSVSAFAEADPSANEQVQRLRSITYNNLGCLYRRMADPEKALHYLQKALTIETMSADPQVNELASTHLNLSASYSVLHKDVEALRHGERAIVLLQGQLWPGLSFKDGMEMLLAKVAKEGGTVPPKLMRDAHVLSMAYHNVGTQNERLGRIREAQVSFNRAVSIGTKILGPSDRMTVTFQMNNRMFLQRNGAVSKSSGLQRSRSGVGLSTTKGSGAMSAKTASAKAGSAKTSAHARTKSALKGKK